MAVDRERRAGRFLLTGSANLLLLPAASESLAGRMEVVRLHPLTEAEKERRPGRFLAQLLAGSYRVRAHAGEPDVGDVVARLLEGGFPEARRRTGARLRQWHRDYVDALIQRDARDVANLRNLDHLRTLLMMLAHDHGPRTIWQAPRIVRGATARGAGQGLRRLAERSGKQFQGGVILHAGRSILPTTDSRMLAVPLAELWTQ